MKMSISTIPLGLSPLYDPPSNKINSQNKDDGDIELQTLNRDVQSQPRTTSSSLFSLDRTRYGLDKSDKNYIELKPLLDKINACICLHTKGKVYRIICGIQQRVFLAKNSSTIPNKAEINMNFMPKIMGLNLNLNASEQELFFEKIFLYSISQGWTTPKITESIRLILAELGFTSNRIKQATEKLSNALYNNIKNMSENDIIDAINAGADLNIKDYCLNTSLIWALKFNFKNASLRIIQYGLDFVDLNAKNWKGLTALHFAAWNGYLEHVELLVAAGANINAVGSDTDDDGEDYGGWTPLRFAGYYKHNEVVKLLLRLGADKNMLLKSKFKHIENYTHLHIAVWNNNLDMVKLLIEAKVDLNKLSGKGRTALDLAFKLVLYVNPDSSIPGQVNEDIFNLLTNAGAKLSINL